ncbi:hypothetical protein FHE65_28885 [Mumia zhuanghuii]|uniref:Uncharacterized protein n=1 Tax=Mumia zhuanghuii TaxID=2585211 RepID=A0A5C4MB58_9ACTN|nr:hypothetical protein FHE65_28885 [Mumia zhuanghuii]
MDDCTHVQRLRLSKDARVLAMPRASECRRLALCMQRVCRLQRRREPRLLGGWLWLPNARADLRKAGLDQSWARRALRRAK